MGLVNTIVSAVGLVSTAAAFVAEPKMHTYRNLETGNSLSYVNNSGICESTPGVGQNSGYFKSGKNTTASSMFFWHFEARQNADTAPLAMWLGGGPGCSALAGIFSQNGPCRMEVNDTEPHLNPLSFNGVSNMLYVDQPIGTGFSHGADNYNSTFTAAPQVWSLLQTFYGAFPQYKGREFGIFSESYGGHWGPAFLAYFQDQNAAIDAGTVTGEKVNVVALGVNNGLFDYEIQFKSYVDFAYNNTYKQLINETQFNALTDAYNTKCKPIISGCTDTSAAGPCLSGYVTCAQAVMSPITSANNFLASDIRKPSATVPPEPFEAWVTQPSIMKAIGAKGDWNLCGSDPFNIMFNSGDLARPFVDSLSTLVQSNVTTLIWAGDADWTCNWRGCLAVANAIKYDGTDDFNAADFTSWTINGTTYGQYKTVGKLSYLTVYDSGHLVTRDQPFPSLYAFAQTMGQKAIFST